MSAASAKDQKMVKKEGGRAPSTRLTASEPVTEGSVRVFRRRAWLLRERLMRKYPAWKRRRTEGLMVEDEGVEISSLSMISSLIGIENILLKVDFVQCFHRRA